MIYEKTQKIMNTGIGKYSRIYEVQEEQTQILKALNTLTEPAGCKAIGEAADMPWRKVMGKLRGLKKEELIESPDKGVYVISDKGKAAIS